MSTWNFNSNLLYVLRIRWRVGLAVVSLAPLPGTFSAAMCTQSICTFPWRKGNFHSKVRRKYRKAYFGSLSHPPCPLAKGGGMGLMEEWQEEETPGTIPHMPVGRGAWP